MSALFHPGDLPALRLPSVLGQDPLVRSQVMAVLFSSATYAGYGVITAVQAALGLMKPESAWAFAVFAVLVNGLFYALVRSGRVATGRDPGLARTQLVVGILLMYAGYAAIGPAATGLLVVMASHVVYSMFSMTPRQVWIMVGSTLTGLVATMVACGLARPERYDTAVQVSGLLYALLVMPLIALLAYRVTAMTRRLREQHAELQSALARLQELATRDELTGVHNRRHMTELLQMQQRNHARLGQPMALALIDIDHFKAVNDRHGHAVGDEVLRTFAEQARRQLRTADLLARWGGEEFLVLMPQTACADALAGMNRLQQVLADGAGSMPHGLQLSFSAGVTEVSATEPLEQAIERADRAMYRAKTQGRARCIGA